MYVCVCVCVYIYSCAQILFGNPSCANSLAPFGSAGTFVLLLSRNGRNSCWTAGQDGRNSATHTAVPTIQYKERQEQQELVERKACKLSTSKASTLT